MRPAPGEMPRSAISALINPKGVRLPDKFALSDPQIRFVALACLARALRLPDSIVDALPTPKLHIYGTLFQYLSQTARQVPTHSPEDVIKRVAFDKTLFDVDGKKVTNLFL